MSYRGLLQYGIHNTPCTDTLAAAESNTVYGHLQEPATESSGADCRLVVLYDIQGTTA